jgi:hypothetical protein
MSMTKKKGFMPLTLKVIEDKAALFASRGFATLSLAFFGVKDLPISYAT